MINRAMAWVRNAREQRRKHTSAFDAVAATDANGVTVFQMRCIEAISTHVSPTTYRRVAMMLVRSFWWRQLGAVVQKYGSMTWRLASSAEGLISVLKNGTSTLLKTSYKP
jgi:hypothetical protein